MSMTLRVGLLLLAVLLPALLGSTLLHTLALRDALGEQQRQRNQDAASMLALALSQQGGERELLTLVVAAQFDTGHYGSIVLRDAAGAPLVERRVATAAPGGAPAWAQAALARWLPMDAAPGVAQVATGWQVLGRVEVQAQSGWAQAALWQALQRSALWLFGLGVLSALLAAATLRAWQRPLLDAVAQARSLEEGRYVIAREPALPELRRLSQAMNSLVRRLQRQFIGQADEVERLKRQAQLDPVTGLPHRRPTLVMLDTALSTPTGSTLLLLRVRDVRAMNARLGHDGTNRLLAALAEVLQSYPARAPGAFAGRLNGCDFLLHLPRAGLAQETAQSLLAALQAALQRLDPAAGLIIGGVEGAFGAAAAAWLAQADLALARAEAAGIFACQVQALQAQPDGLPAGEIAWRIALHAALSGGRVRLVEHPVVGADGRLWMKVCPLRVQLSAGGIFEPAQHWLPLAARHRLTAALDLSALELALAANAADDTPRCVHVASESLAGVAGAGFVGEVRRRLQAAPQAAARLWIEVPEDAAAGDAAPLVEAATQWRRAGARVGLGHAGHALQRLPMLPQLGLDFITIDGRHLRGLHADESLRDVARSLATLVRPLDLRLMAAGIDDAADLQALWPLGFDAATGPAVA